MSTIQTLTPGDAAPDFTLPAIGTDTGVASLSQMRGSRVVVYFYPKDDTPGCTNQALGFSHHLAEFAESGCQIVGISRDTLAKHEKFTAKHGLDVVLASDVDGSVCKSYGVWVEKKNYGRTYMGIERTTFLIGADGRIERIWNKVRVPGHVAEVLEAVKAE